MIYYDTTKLDAAKHRSGLTRVGSRLREELGSVLHPVRWNVQRREFVDASHGQPVAFKPEHWLLTVELFSEAERPGFWDFLRGHPCHLAAVFHDAIPLQLPHLTWPQSVQRHPEYMKMLAWFDQVWAVSETVRRELVEFWRWQGVTSRAKTAKIELGADFDGGSRVQHDPVIDPKRAALLCVGIVEPRKNQSFLLEVCEGLWREGMDFELNVVGRINPHFGKPIAAQMKALEKREERFRFHAATGDRELARLYANARAVVFPTIAEGCGLPLIEALWRGVPCIVSDLPVLRESASAGGCLAAKINDFADWQMKLRSVLAGGDENLRLQREAMARPIPQWYATGRTVVDALT